MCGSSCGGTFPFLCLQINGFTAEYPSRIGRGCPEEPPLGSFWDSGFGLGFCSFHCSDPCGAEFSVDNPLCILYILCSFRTLLSSFCSQGQTSGTEPQLPTRAWSFPEREGIPVEQGAAGSAPSTEPGKPHCKTIPKILKFL